MRLPTLHAGLLAPLALLAALAACAPRDEDSTRRRAYLDRHPNTERHIADAIMRGEVVAGMSLPEATAAVGPLVLRSRPGTTGTARAEGTPIEFCRDSRYDEWFVSDPGRLIYALPDPGRPRY